MKREAASRGKAVVVVVVVLVVDVVVVDGFLVAVAVVAAAPPAVRGAIASKNDAGAKGFPPSSPDIPKRAVRRFIPSGPEREVTLDSPGPPKRAEKGDVVSFGVLLLVLSLLLLFVSEVVVDVAAAALALAAVPSTGAGLGTK